MSPHIFCCYRGKEGATDDRRKRVAAYWQDLCATTESTGDILPCQIGKGLYLGAIGAAENKTALKSENVTHILTVGSYLRRAHPDDFKYKTIEVVDKVDEDISRYFVECYNFIEQARGMGGAVLVHCFAGRSRSVTIIIAYLMKKYGKRLVEALECVREKRPIVSPNPGFMICLQNYERYLHEEKEKTRNKKERYGNGLLGFINIKNYVTGKSNVCL